ncbi:MAG: RES family NAD+ phosphorylase [Legionella sp.]|nr:RES family NAD+ phosphorylase [Legionella sp.]
MDIWSEVKGEQYIQPMMATIHRVTDDQQLIATMSLVNNVEEQGILEQLLEETKPEKPIGYEDFDYLLISPFRYPPLQYGSRFGSVFEPSLFYGSLNITTALAETAFYRFIYLSGMKTQFTAPLQVTYSSYTVSVRSNSSIFLDKAPFDQYQEIIASPIHYQATQALGYAMRRANIEVFQFSSVRDAHAGKNIALFTPKAFQSKSPIKLERWICNVTHEAVGFVSSDNLKRFSFTKNMFLVDNAFTVPA